MTGVSSERGDSELRDSELRDDREQLRAILGGMVAVLLAGLLALAGGVGAAPLTGQAAPACHAPRHG